MSRSSRRTGGADRTSTRTTKPSEETETFEVTLSNSLTAVKESQYLKIFMYGKTGCGSTYGSLDILRSPRFKGKLIYINTDVPQNLRDNINLLTDEEKERVIIPLDQDGEYMRVSTPAQWESIWKQLETEYGDFNECAGIVVDYIENIYDGYIARRDPQTPMKYGKPRKEFYEAVLAPLMRSRTNVIVVGKERPVYVDVGQGDQYKKHMGDYTSFLTGSLEKWQVDFNMILYRETVFRDDRLKRDFMTVFEKHKLGLKAFELEGADSNLFSNIYEHYLVKQKELRG